MQITSLIFFVLIGALFTFMARKHWQERRFIWEVWSAFRPPMVIECFALVVATYVTFSFLDALGRPFTWGWYSLLTGNSGNVGVQPIVDASRSMYLPVKLAGFGIFILLLLLTPFHARSEELQFRQHFTTWRRILPASLKFGLYHLWVGVPLSVALALSLSGLYYGWNYKRAFERAMDDSNLMDSDVFDSSCRFVGDYKKADAIGIFRSTVHHTCYNSLLMLFVLVILLERF
jgi:hypothetical protein